MRKRISCKVIRTIPLGTSVDEKHSTSRLNDMSHNINNGTRTSGTNPRCKEFGKSVIYTDRLKIRRIPIDNRLTTSILNFYA